MQMKAPRWTKAGIVVLIVVVLASLFLVPGISGSSGPTTSADVFETIPPTPGYDQNVTPNPAMEFESSTIGFWMQDQGAAPIATDFGSQSSTLDWTGNSIATTTDGGSTWTTLLDSSYGPFWGIDFLSPTEGFAVSTTHIWTTSNGGTSWSVIDEPTDDLLVRVDFTSATQGFGLDGQGALFTTTNAGSTWTYLNSQPETFGSICANSTSIVAIAQSGALYLSTNDGTTWTQTIAPLTSDDVEQVTTDLSCSSEMAIATLSASPDPEGDGIPYLVYASTNFGGSWTSVGDSIDGTGAAFTDDAVAVGPVSVGPSADTGVVLGYLSGPGSLDLESIDSALTATGTPLPGTTPDIPTSAQDPTLQSWGTSIVHAVSFINNDTGWVEMDVADSGQQYESAVYSTTDGGSNWTLQYTSVLTDVGS